MSDCGCKKRVQQRCNWILRATLYNKLRIFGNRVLVINTQFILPSTEQVFSERDPSLNIGQRTGFPFWPKRNEVTGEWRRLQHKESYALCSSSNDIRVLKSRRMRQARYVLCMVHIEFWWGNLKGGEHSEYLGLHGRIVLKRIFKKWDRETWPGLI